MTDEPEVPHEPQHPEPRAPDRSRARDARTGQSAAAARMQEQSTWVDLQIRQAMERGEFDDLPGAGKPLEGLGTEHDPDWWLKKLVEREQVTGVLPPALAIRKEDAELDARLDRITVESEVRRELEEFNAHVRKALYTPPPGPSAPAHPVITRQRDVDAEVEAWRARRTARVEAQRAALRAQEATEQPRRRPWWSWSSRRRPARGGS